MQVHFSEDKDRRVFAHYDRQHDNLLFLSPSPAQYHPYTQAGYQVEQARNGLEAWEKLQSGLSCNVILCDIEMPKMNGLEFLARLQEDSHLAEIPVAMITSRGSQKMQTMAQEKGARAYFVKPYLDQVLLDSTQRLMEGEILIGKGEEG